MVGMCLSTMVGMCLSTMVGIYFPTMPGTVLLPCPVLYIPGYTINLPYSAGSSTDVSVRPGEE